jgi:hypothetical protein
VCVLVLADDVHSAERHRTNLRFHDGSGSTERLDRVLYTLCFGPSRHSRVLQAVDLLTHMRSRRSTVKEATARAALANDAIWPGIQPIIIVGRDTNAQ